MFFSIVGLIWIDLQGGVHPNQGESPTDTRYQTGGKQAQLLNSQFRRRGGAKWDVNTT